ncbi:MAG TPA: hypothetical protein VNJ06_00115 [Gemmatimonadales bacterium]|nr:hypothetical protein [Gemmatimonadales bacterium]
MPDPTLLGACAENLPLLPIMRQFDFGQFVFLYQKPETPAASENGNGGRIGDLYQRIGAVSRRIVIDPSGGRLQAVQDWVERKGYGQVTRAGRPPVPVETDLLGGVALQRLFEPADVSSPVEMSVAPTTLGDVINKEQIEYDGHQYTLDIGAAAADALARGEPTLVLAAAIGASAPQFMTQLIPDVPALALDAGAVDGLLASGKVQSQGAVEKVAVDASVSRALLAGESVVVWTNGSSNSILRLVPPAPVRRPADSNVVIEDLAQFFGQPQIDGADGLPIPLILNSANVQQLRATGSTTIAVAGAPVTVRYNALGLLSVPRLIARGLVSGGSQQTAVPRRVAPVPESGPRIPVGIRLAVFMPWRQTWELMGFSRGELRSSLALAPQEETTIEVSSWERRLRTLDQSSETDVDQSFESSQTERATDDVFQEMTKHHDFNWQVDGSLDATYSTGNGSISVGVHGQVSDASQLQSIARNTHQGMKESTQKAAAKIRSIRTTHITDSIEEGSQSRVTRHIKNPNFSHTLTLDFFETLAHYNVTLAAVPERLRLVALLDNPMATTAFSRDLVRSNEIALRRALLDSSLLDGFDACRKTSAYEKAVTIISEQASMAATTANATTNGAGIVEDLASLPPSAQEKAVVELLTQIAAAYHTVITTKRPENPPPSQNPAMSSLQNTRQTNDDDRIEAQHCLFLQLASKFLPGLLGVIKTVPLVPTIADAAALAAAIPAPGDPMSFAKFRDVSARDKEDAGMGNAITLAFGAGTMGAANGLCMANNLYTPDDGGLGGLLDSLYLAYKEYLSKRSDGAFKEDTAVAIAKATANQDKLSAADKLAMAFPLDELASAREREEALLAHLKAHADHYRFALFQGLSPAEQSKYIEDSGLEVGTFEPRVLAISGPQLAVPLAPPPAGDLRTFIEGLRASFSAAFGSTGDTPETFIFPTAGMSINSRLGECTACEPFIENSRTIELRRLAAVADSAEHEATRRANRIVAGELGDPVVENAPLHVLVEAPA